MRILASLVFLLVLTCAASAQQSQPVHILSAANDNATNIKPAPGQLVGVVAINTTATLYYLKFYDTAGTPVCGTTKVVLSFPVPFGATSAGGGFVIPLPQATQFLKGIGICLTGALADNDDTSAATGVAMNFFFK